MTMTRQYTIHPQYPLPLNTSSTTPSQCPFNTPLLPPCTPSLSIPLSTSLTPATPPLNTPPSPLYPLSLSLGLMAVEDLPERFRTSTPSSPSYLPPPLSHPCTPSPLSLPLTPLPLTPLTRSDGCRRSPRAVSHRSPSPARQRRQRHRTEHTPPRSASARNRGEVCGGGVR